MFPTKTQKTWGLRAVGNPAGDDFESADTLGVNIQNDTRGGHD